MFTLKHSTLAAMAMIAILITDIVNRLNSFIGVSNGSTALVLALNVCSALVLLFLAMKTRWRATLPKSARMALVALVGWSAITLVRGAVIAPDYWSWKELLVNHLFMYLVPLSLVIGLELKHFKCVYSTVIFIVFPIALSLIHITLAFDTELFQRVALPVYLLLLLLPFLKRRYQFIVLVMAVVSVLMDLSYRANVLRIAAAALLAGLLLLRIRLPRKVLNAGLLIGIGMPLLLLALGLTGRYNVFHDGSGYDKSVTVMEGGVARESPLQADTRTFLYSEVITSMMRRGSSFIAGQGAGTGYDSAVFSGSIVGASGRGGSEVGFLNTLLYSGLIGVFLYAAMLFLAVYYAFNRSSNDLAKLLGLFLLFKWALFFIEDIPKMDLNFFVTWIIIGLCLSNEFRHLGNGQVKDLFRDKHRAILANDVNSGATKA